MAVKREFQEFTGIGTDQDGEDSESTITAHVVTKDTSGEVTTRTGNETVRAGSVLVETDRPGIYDVLSADQWASTGYGQEAATAPVADEPSFGVDDDDDAILTK